MKPARKPGQHSQVIIEDIETEGDRQLKLQLKRQLDTSGRLNDHLSKKKTFTEPAVYKPLGDEVAGSHTLSEFLGNEEQNEKLDQLRHCGLTSQEIEIYLQSQRDDNIPRNSGYGTTPAAHTQQLEAIWEKIRSRENALENPTRFSGVKAMSRHEMDLERSLTHDKEKAALLSTLVVEQGHADPSWSDSRHPINHLDAILQEAIKKRRRLQETNGQFTVATCAPRPPDHKPGEGRTDVGESAEGNIQELYNEDKAPSVCQDCPALENSETCEPHSNDSITSKCASGECSPKKDITKSPQKDDEGRTVLHGNVESIPRDVILKYKLTTDEIRQIDRFKNYDPGVPNKILYVKNLSAKVSKMDLVSLFQRFQQSEGCPVSYRLMTGRMAGQAFVTFHDEATATEALNLVNGYRFKGKPAIIQYGKKT